MYSFDEKITSNKIINFLKGLLNISKNKRVFMIWNNARIHISKTVEEFISQYEENLFILNLPYYSLLKLNLLLMLDLIINSLIFKLVYL